MPFRPSGRRLLAVPSLLLLTSTLRAQPAPAGEAPPADTEVVVRGAPPPRSASDTELDARLLRAAPHRNASELLQSVPGLFVSQHGGEGKAHQIFFRGFDAAHGQDVEVWAGGAPVNEVSNIHGQGYADLHFLIPEVVRSLHALPGSYDPRQGDFAVAGSMAFDLGYDEPGLTLRAAAGSFAARRLFLAYRPADGDGTTFGAFELGSSDGFGPARAARHVSGIAQAAGSIGGGLRGRALVTTYAGRFDSPGVLRLDDVESGRTSRFATYDPKQGGTSTRTSVVLELVRLEERDGGAPARLTLSPFLVLRGLTLRSNFTGFLTHPEGDSLEQRNDTTTVGARAAYRLPVALLSEHDALEAGLYLRTDLIRQAQHRVSLKTGSFTDDAGAPGVDADVRGTNGAAYVDAELHPIRRVTLRGGLRADGLSYVIRDAGPGAGQARSAFGVELQKRVSLDVVALPGLHALASFGEGFRSPSARQLGDGEPTPFTRVTSYEIGARYAPGPAFFASLAAYRTALSDDLVFDHATNRSVAAPATTRTGVAAALGARPSPRFLSHVSVTLGRAVFARSGSGWREDELVPYVPGLVARTDLAYTPALAVVAGHRLDAHLGVGTTYVGSRPLPYSERAHDVFLVDASASLRGGPVALGLEAFNLLDARWFDGEFVYASAFGSSQSRIPARHVTVGPPRSVLVTLSLFL